MKKVYIIPTGDEINNGVVLDLDSAEIMTQILRNFPQCEITRVSPVLDIQDAIIEKMNELQIKNPDLIVLIGGSGGGHRYSDSLGKDFTHSALCEFLDEVCSREIYGKNGHMWSKLICGKKQNTMIINVPGPFVEASAAIKAFVSKVSKDSKLEEIVHEMALAVFEQYPNEAKNKIEIV